MTVSPSSTDTKMNKLKILIINIALILVLGAVAIWGVFWGLKSYTRHNDVITIPEITGLTVDEATQTLDQLSLTLIVTDSVFNTKTAPGIILESTPKVGAHIKKDRPVFVVINATSVLKRQVPGIQDVSLRQAMASLRAAGFEDITVKYIGGAHNDLVLGLKTINGNILRKGDNIPYNTPLILEVSISDPRLMLRQDSTTDEAPPVIMEESEDENWF